MRVTPKNFTRLAGDVDAAKSAWRKCDDKLTLTILDNLIRDAKALRAEVKRVSEIHQKVLG